MNLNLLWVILSAVLIVTADAFIKKISIQGSFVAAVSDPWMLIIGALYILQIFLAVLIFNNKGGLAIYTNLFVVFYSLLGIIFGVFFFKESLSIYQLAGCFLAVAAAILLSW